MSTRQKRKFNKAINKFMLISYISLAIIFLFIGLLLVFHKPIISDLIVPQKIENSYKKHAIPLKYNSYQSNIDSLNPNLAFNFNAVKPINLMDIKDVEFDKRYMIGQIAIPNVHLNLPIFYGISNNNLWFGACTMKPHQQMGEGNYALAGHTMPNETLLFTPIHSMQKGDTIYLTDSKNVYIYKTQNIQLVNKEHGDVINDVQDKKLLTLVTCSDLKGTKRLIVTAHFVNKERLNNSNKQLFNI